MQVAALQLFLRSLQPALEAAGDGRAAARTIDEACRALEPFRSLGLAEFAVFLRRADEYQQSGAVRVPRAGDIRAEELLAAIAKLGEAVGRERPSAPDLAAAQANVARAVGALARDAGLKGSLTPDPKWAEARVARSHVAPHLRTIQQLASQITSPDAYADHSVREEIQRLEAGLDRGALKAVGSEFGVAVTARSPATKILTDVLARLTGHQPPKGKSGGRTNSTAAPVDPMLVDEHSRRLAGLIARSSDPVAVPDHEIEAELNRLKGLSKLELAAVVARAGVEGVKPRDAFSSILQRVRNRLTAARRARERAEV
jgi:hypothetical protein